VLVGQPPNRHRPVARYQCVGHPQSPAATLRPADAGVERLIASAGARSRTGRRPSARLPSAGNDPGAGPCRCEPGASVPAQCLGGGVWRFDPGRCVSAGSRRPVQPCVRVRGPGPVGGDRLRRVATFFAFVKRPNDGGRLGWCKAPRDRHCIGRLGVWRVRLANLGPG
jgi:hypothetical protein